MILTNNIIFISLWELCAKAATKIVVMKIIVKTVVEIVMELLWRLLLGLLFLLPPILAVNIYNKAKAVRIKGVFRNRFSVIIMGIK